MGLMIFKPYLEINKGHKTLHDYLQFHIYFYNRIGIHFSILGYGFNVGFWWYDTKL